MFLESETTCYGPRWRYVKMQICITERMWKSLYQLAWCLYRQGKKLHEYKLFLVEAVLLILQTNKKWRLCIIKIYPVCLWNDIVVLCCFKCTIDSLAFLKCHLSLFILGCTQGDKITNNSSQTLETYM